MTMYIRQLFGPLSQFLIILIAVFSSALANGVAGPSFERVSVKRLGPCSVDVNGKIIDLTVLQRSDGLPRVVGKERVWRMYEAGPPTGCQGQDNAVSNTEIRFSTRYNSWNYSFNPCIAFNEPLNPHISGGFGDFCVLVSMCKFKHEQKRDFFYGIGTQSSAEFTAQKSKTKNYTKVEMSFTGIRSLRHKKTHINLVCDRFRVKPEDAEFKITVDKIRGDIYAELEHVCACPGACGKKSSDLDISYYYNSTSEGSEEVIGGMLSEEATKEKPPHEPSSAPLLLIVAGVNIGLLILAVFIGGLCYRKRTALRAYKQLPGIHTNLSNLGRSGKVLSCGPHSKPRNAYRDYEPAEDKVKFLPILNDCEIPIKSLEVKQRLGGNIFGDTYRGHWNDTCVAIKCITHGIRETERHSDVVEKIKNEVSLLSKQRHKNIAAVIGMCLEAKFPYIINEFIYGQSVREYLIEEQSTTWLQKIRMCIQAADGLNFLHSVKPRAILHRDVRCANLMITTEEIVVVVDFGITKILQPVREECKRNKCFCQKELSACPASIRWTAPEILDKPGCHESEATVTPSCDVYSFGMLMWEMIMCCDPFSEITTELEIMEIVKAGGRPTIPPTISVLPKYRDLMKLCWNESPEQRPPFKQVVSMLKETMSQARNFEKQPQTPGRSETPVTHLV